MFRWVLTAIAAMLTLSAYAAEPELQGTWKLVSAERKILDTGETEDLKQQGYITYGADGRMMVLNVVAGRPRSESLAKLTDQERAELFRTMVAYGGRYKFDGKTMEHYVDVSWNEIWTGTTQTRDVKLDGDRLIFTTRPAPFSSDGRVSTTTLTWERLK